LFLSEASEELVNRTPDSQIVAFENLSDYKQEIMTDALKFDCAVGQRAFKFGGDNPRLLRYEGKYYKIYVGVKSTVTTTTQSR